MADHETQFSPLAPVAPHEAPGLVLPQRTPPQAQEPRSRGGGGGFTDALQSVLPLLITALVGGVKGPRAGGGFASGLLASRERRQDVAQRQQQLETAQLQQQDNSRRITADIEHRKATQLSVVRGQRLAGEQRHQEQSDSFIASVQAAVDSAVNFNDAQDILIHAEEEGRTLGINPRFLRKSVFVSNQKFSAQDARDFESALNKAEDDLRDHGIVGKDANAFRYRNPVTGQDISVGDAKEQVGRVRDITSSKIVPLFGEVWARVLNSASNRDVSDDFGTKRVPTKADGSIDHKAAVEMMRNAGLIVGAAGEKTARDDEVDSLRELLVEAARNPLSNIDLGVIKKRFVDLGIATTSARWDAELARAQRSATDALVEFTKNINELTGRPLVPLVTSADINARTVEGVARARSVQERGFDSLIPPAEEVVPEKPGWFTRLFGGDLETPVPASTVPQASLPVVPTVPQALLPAGQAVPQASLPAGPSGSVMTEAMLRNLASRRGIPLDDAREEMLALGIRIQTVP